MKRTLLLSVGGYFWRDFTIKAFNRSYDRNLRLYNRVTLENDICLVFCLVTSRQPGRASGNTSAMTDNS